MKNKTATTVKVDSALYDEFKILGVRNKMTLQKLIERTVYRYVNEETYRENINCFVLPVITDPMPEVPILVISASIG